MLKEKLLLDSFFLNDCPVRPVWSNLYLSSFDKFIVLCLCVFSFTFPVEDFFFFCGAHSLVILEWFIFWVVMADTGSRILIVFLLASAYVSAQRSVKHEALESNASSSVHTQSNNLLAAMNFLWQPNQSGYQHVWPVSCTRALSFTFPLIPHEALYYCFLYKPKKYKCRKWSLVGESLLVV